MQDKSGETLNVLNPRGKIDASPLGISPRVAGLEGKKIGLYWNGKPDGDYFWATIGGLLKDRFPTATVFQYNGPGDVGETLASKFAKELDVMMYGVGD
jgi:hypothetical protein